MAGWKERCVGRWGVGWRDGWMGRERVRERGGGAYHQRGLPWRKLPSESESFLFSTRTQAYAWEPRTQHQCRAPACLASRGLGVGVPGGIKLDAVQESWQSMRACEPPHVPLLLLVVPFPSSAPDIPQRGMRGQRGEVLPRPVTTHPALPPPLDLPLSRTPTRRPEASGLPTR
eukprot:1110439-Rhodomonas_salina.2